MGRVLKKIQHYKRINIYQLKNIKYKIRVSCVSNQSTLNSLRNGLQIYCGCEQNETMQSLSIPTIASSIKSTYKLLDPKMPFSSLRQNLIKLLALQLVVILLKEI